jgi:predicted metal-dependent peptidase
MVFYYDPETIAQWPIEWVEFGWFHETLHIMLHHFDRCGDRDARLYNLAGDLFINQTGAEADFIVPPFALMPQKMGFPLNLTTDEYYELLLKQAQSQQQAGCAQDTQGSTQQGAGQGSGKRGGGPPQGQYGQPRSSAQGGGAATQGAPQNPTQQRGEQGASEKSENYGPFAGQCGSCAGGGLQNDEPTGEDAGGRSEVEISQSVKATAEAVKQHAQQGQGRLPAGLVRWAESILGPPRIPWQTKLARLTRSAIAYRPGAVDWRYSRTSRRQAAIGFGVGKPIMPALVAPVPRVAVVLDTSGSMGTEEVRAGLEETAGILKAVGATVTFLACDAQVHSLQKVASPGQLAKLVKGGGGTDFVPAFEALGREKERPEVIVFITDGLGRAPATPPPKTKTIWLLIGPYKQKPCEWGEVIELDSQKSDG